MIAAVLRASAFVLLVPAAAQAQRYSIDWYETSGSTNSSAGGRFEVTSITIGDSSVGSIGVGGALVEGGFLAVTLPRTSRGTITSFTATAGLSRVRLSWQSEADQPGLVSFVLSRKPLLASGQNYSFIREVSYTGSGAYDFVDLTSVPGERYQYLLSERYRAGAPIPRVTVAATAFGAQLPANTVRVGLGGFADIAGAIAAGASRANWVILVQPGSYPHFSVTPNSPTKLRILADGTGLVSIDTTKGPVSIAGRTLGQVVELRGLDVGATSAAHPAMQITNCQGLVIVDDSTIRGADNQPGLFVTQSTAVALQGCELTGSPGLLAAGASTAIASRGVIDSLTLTGASTLTLCQVDLTTRKVAIDSTLSELDGLMPNIEGTAFHSWAAPLEMKLETFVHGPLVFMISADNLWRTGTNFEMAVLLSASTLLVSVPAVADSRGASAMSFALPKSVSLLGVPFPTQFAALDPVTSTVRLSNARTFVILQ